MTTTESIWYKPYTPEEARVCAARGAVWMDENCPGWVLEINSNTLDLSEGYACILGQTAHCVTHGKVQSGNPTSYDRTINWICQKLKLDPEGDGAGRWEEDHGFSISGGDEEPRMAWEMLTAAWLEEISSRLNAPGS